MALPKTTERYTSEYFTRDEPETVRQTIALTGKWLELWNELVEGIDTRSNAGIIKEALRLRGFFLSQQLSGQKVRATVLDERGDPLEIDDVAQYLALCGVKADTTKQRKTSRMTPTSRKGHRSAKDI